MSPPESTVAWTGDIFNRIGFRMVISMVRDPRVRRSRSIEYGSPNEHLLDNGIELHRPMSKAPVVCHRCAQCAHAGQAQAPQKYFPSWNGEHRDTDQRKHMNRHDVYESPRILAFDFPPRKRPWMLFGKILSN